MNSCHILWRIATWAWEVQAVSDGLVTLLWVVTVIWFPEQGFDVFWSSMGPSISAAPESGSGCGLPPRLLFLVWDWWLFICLAGSGAVSSLFLRYGLFIPFKGVLLGWRGGLAMTLAEPALRSAGGGCVRDCGYRRESIHHHHHLQNGKCEPIDLISGGTNVTRVWHVWRSDQDKP